MLEVVVARAPGMDFEDAKLGEGSEGFGSGGLVGEGDVGLDDTGFFIGNGDRADAGGKHGVDVLLEEALLGGALGTANEGERVAGDFREHASGDGVVVVGEGLLGELGFGVEDFGGVGEADGGMGVAGCRLEVAGWEARVFAAMGWAWAV